MNVVPGPHEIAADEIVGMMEINENAIKSLGFGMYKESLDWYSMVLGQKMFVS